MKQGRYILSLDQGTTSSRAILFSGRGEIVGMGQKTFQQHYPQPGYVEHDAEEILSTQIYAMHAALENAGVSADQIDAIGITNQRETTVAWDAQTGKPIYHAIVWQCRRTAPECEKLKAEGWEDYIHETTGLILDAYFSGTKMKWYLDNVPEAKALAAEGRLRFGTIDTWLIYCLTKGKSYVTDVSNACRTMLFDINKLAWDEKIMQRLGIPASALPQVVQSSGIVGYCSSEILGCEIPIAGIAGDQPSALFGQCCFDAGMAKNTYGTGCFVLMNAGDKPVMSKSGLLTTIGWQLDGKVAYALEGSAFNAGSAIDWLRDGLELIEKPSEADMLAESVEDCGGVYFVPAFTGLGAPYWDMYARGGVMGMTRGTTRAHFARAVLESLALESYDLFHAMENDIGMKIKELRVDGGASKSRFLMQFQCDLLECSVLRPECLETTALGAAMLAGLAVGMWDGLDELRTIWKSRTTFQPEMSKEWVEQKVAKWHKAVERCLAWEKD
ncbi:glycerol kinase GlpK [Yeguia hominis]|uniref:Glycerol kinase n=1 Tax=Yeguia hominis TaxID=2763662 RepID=A0A926D9F6_9FIRM|nr:glycerol kinase GlpK [Yeguia hominis]MBC8532830.1 glycerol kinase GlpK [Yeguia hominis]